MNDRELNEEKLVELAIRHGVSALVARYGRLKVELFADSTAMNIQRNLRMTGELITILRFFESEGLKAIPYKGPTLAAIGYGDLALREFGDLDLLIDRESFNKAHVILCDRGYEPEIELDSGRWPLFMGATNVLAYWHPGKEISVELHWELSPRYLPFPYDFNALYQRREASYPGGREVLTLSGEDLLLYLCLHGAKHGWERLSWIIDVGGVIRRHTHLDWERVIDDALDFGCDRTLGLGLALAREVTLVKLPAQAERMISDDNMIPALVGQVIEWIGRDEPPSLAAQTRFLLQLQKRPAEKIRMLYRIISTPSVADWRALRLPVSLIWLYRLLRPLRLLMKVEISKK